MASLCLARVGGVGLWLAHQPAGRVALVKKNAPRTGLQSATGGGRAWAGVGRGGVAAAAAVGGEAPPGRRGRKRDQMDALVDAIRAGGPDGTPIAPVLADFPQLNNRAATKIISKLTRARYWDAAVQVFEAMRDSGAEDLNAYTYCAIIASYGKAREWKQALSAFEAMKAEGLEPDVATYNSVINACEAGGAWKRTTELLEEMEVAGVAPNAITYTAVIAACEKAKQWDRAVKVYDEMKQAGFEPTGGRPHGVR